LTPRRLPSTPEPRVLIYALLGGADFGSGFYDLTAGNAQRGAQVRTDTDRKA
jgi:hypothetical protein